ncbi:hypothetical protein [Paraburkholderia humisilvae]|uniref:Lipoprotein n=1 Tax=Paraburkholderia humisilvae TaxID=627669 RepID=A0A6J5DV23_9BURK|nr:hypothetical protein [Paraburkholderia humisilvae]CAB3757141.1 hypothetical protein LMG29542_03016 [Paraburkholderia humisilvae]
MTLTANPICFAVALIMLTAGCTSTGAPETATHQTARAGSTETDSYLLHMPDSVMSGGSASKPPRLSVGVSDPDTQLILPWFLNDIINFVNYR